MGKARNKLSGLALSEWRAKHPFDPATGRFMSKEGGISAPSAPDVPSAPTPGRARARLGLASKVDMPAALETLRAKKAAPVSGDREAVDAILKPMTHAQLDEVAREHKMDHFVRGTKEQKINQLREGIVGARLDHDAIMRTDLSFKPSFPEPEPTAPSPTAARQARSAKKALASNPSTSAEMVARMRAEERREPSRRTKAAERQARIEGAFGPSVQKSLFPGGANPLAKQNRELPELTPEEMGRKPKPGDPDYVPPPPDMTPAQRRRSRQAAFESQKVLFPSMTSGEQPAAPAKRGRARAALSGTPNVLVDNHQADIQRQLEALANDGDGMAKAEAILSNLSVPALKELAAALPTVGKSGRTKQQLISGIAEGTVGFRQRAEGTAPGVAAIRAADRLREAAPTPAVPNPAPRPRKAASALQAAAPTSRPSTPGRSPNALLPNTWGGIPDGGSASVHFHPDGVIGQAIRGMGDNRHMEIEGDALANVLGRLATDTVAGRVSAQDQVSRLKAIRDQVPLGSLARRELNNAIEKLDIPETDAPDLPASAPSPVRQLMTELLAIPAVRREPREIDALTQIAADFDQGRESGLGMISKVRQLLGKRHESNEGYFDVIRAVRKAADALEAQMRSDPASMRRRTPGKA